LQACLGSPTTYQWNHNGVPLTGETKPQPDSPWRPAQPGRHLHRDCHQLLGATNLPQQHRGVTVDVRCLVRTANGQVILIWQATPGKHYQVQYRTNLSPQIWLALPSAQSLTTPGVTLSATDSMNNGPRFYRIVLLDP